MRTATHLGAAALLCCLLAQSPAADAQRVVGSGAASCEAVLRDLELDHVFWKTFYASWLNGFVTHWAVSNDAPRLSSNSARFAWVEGYCKRFPKAHLYDAAAALTRELHPDKESTSAAFPRLPQDERAGERWSMR